MNRLLFPVALCFLASIAGCDRMVMPQVSQFYAPWEEGLTLGFENPSLDGARRQSERFQLRVKSSRPGTNGRLVTLTTTTLAGQIDTAFLHRNGGVSLGPEVGGRLRLLPEGFPDRVSRWEDRGTVHRVIGRASVQLPGVSFAEPGAAIGVWVESTPAAGDGPRRRTLYLPNIGEAESLLWDQGRWVCVFRLVSRGFTDLAAPANPQAAQ